MTKQSPKDLLKELENYPILQSIETVKQKQTKSVQEKFNLLLEALAATSSGMYGGGYMYMESALQDAKEFISEHS